LAVRILWTWLISKAELEMLALSGTVQKILVRVSGYHLLSKILFRDSERIEEHCSMGSDTLQGKLLLLCQHGPSKWADETAFDDWLCQALDLPYCK
jgi:hypothetical protein